MNPDFLIIGGGIVGCASAARLSKSGFHVSLIEQGELGHESSWAGGGILYPLLPWYYSDAVSQIIQLSLSLFPEWAREIASSTRIDPEYQNSGMLVLPDYNIDQARDWCAKHQEVLDIAQSRSIISSLDADESALWLPAVSQVRNPRLMKALQRHLKMLDVKLCTNTKVTGFKTKNSRISGVETSNGLLTADQYIVTSGAWSRRLLGEQALGLDIRPIRGQMLLFKTAPGTLRTIILKNGIYLIPRMDGHILVGSTLEDVGFDKTTTEEAKAMLYAQATAILPLLKDAPLVQHWAGLRPGSPDNIPTIDRHPLLENLYINSGHFRYGVTMAPASAEILANLILHRPQAMDTTPYRWPYTQK